MSVQELRNYINGVWIKSASKDYLDVQNPSTGEVIARVPLSTKAEGGSGDRLGRGSIFELKSDSCI